MSQSLRRELKTCRDAGLRHRHILTFMGTTEHQLHTVLISPYMSNGNLAKYLQVHPATNRAPLVSAALRAQLLKLLHS